MKKDTIGARRVRETLLLVRNTFGVETSVAAGGADALRAVKGCRVLFWADGWDTSVVAEAVGVSETALSLDVRNDDAPAGAAEVTVLSTERPTAPLRMRVVSASALSDGVWRVELAG